MTIVRQLQALATGLRLSARYCKICGRRLFDGILVGEIKCRCGILNVFSLEKEEKVEYTEISDA